MLPCNYLPLPGSGRWDICRAQHSLYFLLDCPDKRRTQGICRAQHPLYFRLDCPDKRGKTSTTQHLLFQTTLYFLVWSKREHILVTRDNFQSSNTRLLEFSHRLWICVNSLHSATIGRMFISIWTSIRWKNTKEVFKYWYVMFLFASHTWRIYKVE